MMAQTHSRRAINTGVLCFGLLLLITAIADGAEDKQIILKVVGPDGKSLAGAKVYQHYYSA